MILVAIVCIALGVAIERKRVSRQPILISRLPTRLERDELDVPAVWRQRVARELVFGKGRVIDAQSSEVRT